MTEFSGKGFDKLKRVLDVVVAGGGLVVSAPLQIAVACAVRIKLGRPVIFVQPRPGVNGDVFLLRKFRTMLPINTQINQVTNEQRTTQFGQFLRSTSLDELPSLWNILKGDMSLVGPRPLRTAYLPRYSRDHFRRHEVRPGLTGLAQVNGRNRLDWNSRLDLDVDYVNRRSLGLDFQIVLRTIGQVIRRDSITEEGSVSMSEFFGSGPKLTCRPLEVQDLPERVEWLNNPDTRKGISISFWACDSEMESWFKRAVLDQGRADFICVMEDGSRVSMFGFTRISESPHFYLYVNPNRHGRGLGRLTMVHALKKAKELNIETLRLEVKLDNVVAIQLYKKFGFQKEVITDDGSKWVMVLDQIS